MWTYLLHVAILMTSTNGFSTDVIFKEVGSLSITSGDFYVFVTLDLDDFYRNMHYLKQDAVELRTSVEKLIESRREFSTSDWYLREETALVQLLTKFHSDLQNLEIFFESFLATLPSGYEQKGKENHSAGIFQPAVNKISHFFGIASTDDILNLENLMTTLNDNQFKITDGLNQQIKILNATMTEVSSLQSQFVSLRGHIHKLEESIKNLHERKETETSITLSIIFGQLIENGLNSLTVRLQAFVFALTEAREGIFSPFLLSTNSTLQILGNLPAQIGKALPREVSFQNLPFYYDVIKVKIAHGGFNRKLKTIALLLNIPILSVQNNFKLFKIDSIPIPVPETKYYSELIITDNYFGVSADLDKFVSMKSLDKCASHFENYICQIQTPIYTVASHHCLVSSYLKLNVVDNCFRKLLANFAPRFVRTQKGYLFSIYNEISVLKKCKGNETKVSLKGVGKIVIPKDCMVVSPSLVLPPVLNQKQPAFDIKFNFGNISINQNVSSILNLVNDSDFLQISEELDDKFREGIPIPHLQNKLRVVKVERLFRTRGLDIFGKYSTYAVPILYIGLLLIFLVCTYRYMPCCRFVFSGSKSVRSRGTQTTTIGRVVPRYHLSSVLRNRSQRDGRQNGQR